MSAMPAWGKTLDDAAIWDVVAFVRKLPDMTPETYQQLSQEHAQ
jgi:mono/diheme cytochrome c family protein